MLSGFDAIISKGCWPLHSTSPCALLKRIACIGASVAFARGMFGNSRVGAWFICSVASHAPVAKLGFS